MRKAIAVAVLCLLAIGFMPAPAKGEVYCKASYYWQGTRTANGERFNPDGMTCADRSRRFGTYMRVTNLLNGRSAVCRLNDYGPAKRLKDRCIDVSRGVANVLGMRKAGVVPVKVEPCKGIGGAALIHVKC